MGGWRVRGGTPAELGAQPREDPPTALPAGLLRDALWRGQLLAEPLEPRAAGLALDMTVW
jgi:hypothetical protein